MSSLFLNTKKLWHKTSKMKDSPVTGQSVSSSSRERSPKEPVTIAVIGCGQRGKTYGKYALKFPDRCKVVAIAEPRPKTRSHYAGLHQVDETLVFNSWKDLHSSSAEVITTIGTRLADAVVITVQDNLHVEVAIAFAEQGYHILCEKPMATTVQDCLRMEMAINKAGTIFGMGHVMRYSPYNKAITEIVHSRVLGDLINVVHVEPVGYYHFAHSYVRGNWSNETNSSFSLMTKSCHDIDIICHWLSPAKPVRVSSFGSLRHFKKSAKPAEAGNALRCLDCPIERDCAYSAKKIYLDQVSRGNTEWPVETIVDGLPDIENVTEALANGPYGKCVYESDNDVCDHQIVNLEFSNGSTASFTMVAFTSAICERQTRLHFTNGEIIGDMNTFTITDFRKGTKKIQHPVNEGGGHGGGDLGLARAFVEAVRTGRQEILGTDIGEVLNSHLTVFAAETSRKKSQTVDCADFEREARLSIVEE